MIEIENRSIQDAIKKIRDNYNHISGPNLNKAISNALNRAAQQSRTAANREIRQVYNISASRINQDMKIRYSQPRTLSAYIVSSGSPIPLTSFGVKQETASERVKIDKRGNVSRVTRKSSRSPKSGVSFEIKKGNRQILPSAFIQTANGGTTVFARGVYKGSGEGFEFGKARLPIAKMTTASIPLMFSNEDIMKPVSLKTEAFFNARIEHEINYIIGNVG